MTLTAGSGPFGKQPSDCFNFTPDPPRYYLPPEDVRVEALEASPTRTHCAHKGLASYWHVHAGGERHDDLAWSYPDPQHDAEPVRDRVCSFGERVDLEVDGVLQERPADAMVALTGVDRAR